MILKFNRVTAAQLAELQQFVDSGANEAVCWSEDGHGYGPHRLVELLKTNVGIEKGVTCWQVTLNVRDSIEVGELKGRTKNVPVPRHILVRTLYILDRFPLDTEGEFNQYMVKPEEELSGQASDDSGDDHSIANTCPRCLTSPLVTSGAGRCINCGFLDCDL